MSGADHMVGHLLKEKEGQEIVGKTVAGTLVTGAVIGSLEAAGATTVAAGVTAVAEGAIALATAAGAPAVGTAIAYTVATGIVFAPVVLPAAAIYGLWKWLKD